MEDSLVLEVAVIGVVGEEASVEVEVDLLAGEIMGLCRCCIELVEGEAWGEADYFTHLLAVPNVDADWLRHEY